MTFFKKTDKNFSLKISIIIFLLVLIIIMLYLFVPRKFIISPPIYEEVFGYSKEEFIENEKLITAVWGDSTGKTADFDTKDNLVLYLNKNQIEKWKRTQNILLDDAKSEGVYVSNDLKKVSIKCNKTEIVQKTIDAHFAITASAVIRILEGESSNKVFVKYTLIDEDTNEILKHANWPKEDFTIDTNSIDFN